MKMIVLLNCLYLQYTGVGLAGFPLGNCKALKGTEGHRFKNEWQYPFFGIGGLVKGGIFKGAGTKLL